VGSEWGDSLEGELLVEYMESNQCLTWFFFFFFFYIFKFFYLSCVLYLDKKINHRPARCMEKFDMIIIIIIILGG
jgi:predicted membrane channel-forming protein YqfA (hemolysin III family)